MVVEFCEEEVYGEEFVRGLHVCICEMARRLAQPFDLRRWPRRWVLEC